MPRQAISLDQFDRLTIDPETHQLYWDGKELVTKMSLPWWVQASAVAAAVSTVLMCLMRAVELVRGW